MTKSNSAPEFQIEPKTNSYVLLDSNSDKLHNFFPHYDFDSITDKKEMNLTERKLVN